MGIWEKRFRWLVPQCSDGWSTPHGWFYGPEAEDPDTAAKVIDEYIKAARGTEDMNYFMYTDVYVDAGEGRRWRLHVIDEAGLFEITTEEWDETGKRWKTEEAAPTTSLHVQAIPQLREALKVLYETNDVSQ